jgi:beta-glucosidase
MCFPIQRKKKPMKSRVLVALLFASSSLLAQTQPVLVAMKAPTLRIGKLSFKDLNKNNKLDKYEDWRLPVAERAKDLVSQMTLEEKVGFMLISTTRMGGDQVFANGVQGNAGPRPKITE